MRTGNMFGKIAHNRVRFFCMFLPFLSYNKRKERKCAMKTPPPLQEKEQKSKEHARFTPLDQKKFPIPS